MGAITKTLYETDFAAWADEMAAALRAGRVQELDLENLAEEIEGLAISQRKEVRSQLQRMMMHLLKRRIQPESRSWQVSVGNARDEIVDEIEDSPSLRRHLEQNLERIYGLASNQALRETGLQAKAVNIPTRCPWTLRQLLEGDLDSLS